MYGNFNKLTAIQQKIELSSILVCDCQCVLLVGLAFDRVGFLDFSFVLFGPYYNDKSGK